MCLQENNNPHTAQACRPEFIHTEEFCYKYEERNSTWWPGTNRNIGSKSLISPTSTAILMAAEEKHISLFPHEGRGAPGSLQAPVIGCGPTGVQGAWAACSHLHLALPRPWMCCSSLWRVWSAHGTPLLLASVHECARGISPEHLLSLVPQSTVGWVTEQIYLNSLFPRSYFSKEGNKSMTGKVLTRQKLGSSMT